MLVLDSVGGSVRVDNARHNGMRDLIVGNDGRWTWNGKTYVDTRAAPDVRIPANRAAVKPKPAPKVVAPAPAPAKPEPPQVELPKVAPPAPEAPKPETAPKIPPAPG